MTRRSRMHGPIAVLVLSIALMFTSFGCQSHPQQGPDATVPAPEPPLAGDSHMTFSIDTESKCLRCDPGSVHVRSGTDASFNTSTIDTVWVTAPAGCFSVADTTFPVGPGLNGSHPVAHVAGTYTLSVQPALCAGTGASVIVDAGTDEGTH